MAVLLATMTAFFLTSKLLINALYYLWLSLRQVITGLDILGFILLNFIDFAGTGFFQILFGTILLVLAQSTGMLLFYMLIFHGIAVAVEHM